MTAHLSGSLCVAMVFAVCIIFSSAKADTEPPRVVLGPWVKDLKVGPGMNAAGKNLYGSQFVGQNLAGAVFDDCNLRNVLIDDCLLTRASFRRAVFAGAFIGNCKLEEADFTDAVINEAGYADGRFLYSLELSPAQLQATRSYKTKDLSRCVIQGSTPGARMDFRGANLREAVLTGDFLTANFEGARLYRTTFSTRKVTFDQLRSTADFKAGRLAIYAMGGQHGVIFSGECDFSGIDLRGSTLWGYGANGKFTDSIISDCTFQGGITKEDFYDTKSYKQGDLRAISCIAVDFSGFDFSGVNLTGSRFSQCNFSHARFDDAVISGVNFAKYSTWSVKGLTVEQIKSTWNYKHSRMEGVILPQEVADALPKH